MKGKVYKMAEGLATIKGLQTVALTKRQKEELEVAELKMMRFQGEEMIMYRIKEG